MKFTIKSVEVDNNWYRKPDFKVSDLYPVLKDRITSVRIDYDNTSNYTVYVIEVKDLEELLQLIEEINCDVIVAPYSKDSSEYVQQGINGNIKIYDDYME